MHGESDDDDNMTPTLGDQMAERAIGVMGEAFEHAVVVGRDDNQDIYIRVLSGDPLINVGLTAVAHDALLGIASESVRPSEIEDPAWHDDEEG